ncbi:hypothetical protein ACLVWU_08670 [Bdellovibrio sp. HCB290]|uniref:hypothetical protein n=1 Tax=Bdellovibrio sp. HCB290 TaxID=3394356 RepID=UPI0039B38C92
MISLLYKSKLLREEIKTWAALAGLFLWGATATTVAVTRREKIVLVGIDDAGTRIITNSSDRLVREELKQFLRYFFEMQYSYNEVNYHTRMSFATDLYSEKLWNEQKPKIIQIGENLTKVPLTQTADVLSIDKTESGAIEALLRLRIRSRLNEHIVNLKVRLSYRKIDRHERNPWGFEVTEIHDEAQ